MKSKQIDDLSIVGRKNLSQGRSERKSYYQVSFCGYNW